MSEREIQASAGEYSADFDASLKRMDELIASSAPNATVQVWLLREILIELKALRVDLRNIGARLTGRRE